MLANHPNVLSGGGVATNIIGGTGLFADGTVAAPSISFLADQDTGIYRIGTNNIGVAAGGVLRFRVNPDGITSLGLANQIQTTDYVDITTGTNMQLALLASTGNTSGKLEVYNQGGATGGVLNINTSGGGAVNFGNGNATFGGNIILPLNGYIGKSNSFALQFGGTDYGFVNTTSGYSVVISNSAPTNSLVIAATTGAATFAGAIRASDGSAAAPSISFASDTDNGLYLNGANSLGIAAAGSENMRLSASDNWLKRDSLTFGSAADAIWTRAAGGVTLTLSGTNQNITLTPSGTGVVRIIPIVSASYGCGLEIYSTVVTAYKIAELKRNSGIGGGEINLYNDTNNLKARFGAVGDNYTATTLLLGTTTNSSNGILQLVASTANTGGIGFGADVSLYRAAANVLALDSGDALQLGNQYVNTVAVSTGTVTIRDSTGTVYRLLCVV